MSQTVTLSPICVTFFMDSRYLNHKGLIFQNLMEFILFLIIKGLAMLHERVNSTEFTWRKMYLFLTQPKNGRKIPFASRILKAQGKAKFVNPRACFSTRHVHRTIDTGEYLYWLSYPI